MVGRWDQLRFEAQSDKIEYTNRVFINRNMKMTKITHMGFDMDHTLAVYTDRAQKLAFDLARDNLVSILGYPKQVKELEFEYDQVIRGLVIDKRRGNLIKLDTHKYVEMAYHGDRELEREERKEVYNKPGEAYRPSDDNYSYLDTLFCLPEAYLYRKLVGLMDDLHEAKVVKKRPDYKKLYKDVRSAIDGIHRDGSMKKHISDNIPLYIEKDPLLPKTLLHFLQGQKRLFLLTNSEYYYTNIVLSYLLNGEVPGYDNWQDYFDFIVVSARKPAFFLKEAPLEKIEEDEHGKEIPHEVRNKVFRGGYFKNLEQQIGAFGENILYFGDHTFGDILKSKQTCGWRTAMVILELEDELKTLEGQREVRDRLELLKGSLQEIRDDIMMLENQITHLRNRKIDYYEDLDYEELKDIDAEMLTLRSMIEENEQKATDCLKEIKDLEDRLDQCYNTDWGCLFKSRRRKSRLGDQVEDFACVYTSRITNFSYYPTTKYFRISHDLMAHERQEFMV